MHFMKEVNYMNNTDITVDLVTKDEKELLVFNFETKIELDLTSDDPNDLKKFFQELLNSTYGKKIILKFNESERQDLFYDVSKKYIDHLNNKLLSISYDEINIVNID